MLQLYKFLNYWTSAFKIKLWQNWYNKFDTVPDIDSNEITGTDGYFNVFQVVTMITDCLIFIIWSLYVETFEHESYVVLILWSLYCVTLEHEYNVVLILWSL